MTQKQKVINMDAGFSLRTLMAKHSISREKLANDFGVSVQTISTLRREKWMSGKNLANLSAYFHISPSEFLRIGESPSGE